jgi:hypothetical protein
MIVAATATGAVCTLGLSSVGAAKMIAAMTASMAAVARVRFIASPSTKKSPSP